MPQINRIRVNNVKYNFGTQFYDDFIMRFNCKNTIYDLANGGGKSLLTERYKETIEAAPGELDEMLSEWVSENQVPEHFLEILKDFMNRA